MSTSKDGIGDWRKMVAAPLARLDDVVHAYRWILGREPENPDRLEAHLLAARTQTALRTRFLRSPEFRAQLEALNLQGAGLDGSAEQLPGIARGDARFVFLHVPKTAGTSVHDALARSIPEASIAPMRHNRILVAPAHKCARFRVFSGHFDQRVLSIIPGKMVRCATILRNPRERLISLYRYLAAHRAERAEQEGFELAEAARRLSFEDFLKAALEINASAVDNTYLRTFGSALPIARWEGRAEAEWANRWKVIPEGEATSLLACAMKTLASMDFVGLTERFDDSLQGILTCAGVENRGEPSPKLKVTDAIEEQTAAFEPAPAVKLRPSSILDACVYWDEKIYSAAQRSFESRPAPDFHTHP